MSKEVIHGEHIPDSPDNRPNSPGIQAGGFVFLSGQCSSKMDGEIITDSFEAEMLRTFENIEKILAGANLNLGHIVQVRSYLADQKYLNEYNKIYRKIFSKPYPARTNLIGVLGNVVKFSADVIACKDD